MVVLTGVFLFASTTSRTSNALLGWNCGYTFTSNVMYGVLYAVSPELFPTKDRGTGNALVSIANRIFGIMVSTKVILSPKNVLSSYRVEANFFLNPRSFFARPGRLQLSPYTRTCKLRCRYSSPPHCSSVQDSSRCCYRLNRGAEHLFDCSVRLVVGHIFNLNAGKQKKKILPGSSGSSRLEFYDSGETSGLL